MELQDRLTELTEAGVGVAAISYDSEKTLAVFAERRGITFPLLSDDESAVIKEYGILNTVVAEGLGPDADDPEIVADIHRYVAAEVFDSPQLRRMINGTPFPGTLCWMEVAGSLPASSKSFIVSVLLLQQLC